MERSVFSEFILFLDRELSSEDDDRDKELKRPMLKEDYATPEKKSRREKVPAY